MASHIEMKIVLVSHTAAIGGAELVLLEMAQGLVDRAKEVDVIVPGPGHLAERLKAAGIRTWTLNYDWWAGPPQPLREIVSRAGRTLVSVPSFLKLLRRLGPDVVVTNTLTIPPAAIAAKILRIPHVWYLHEFGKKDPGFSFDLGFSNTIRLISRLSARVLVNSRAVFDEFTARIPVSKLHVVYCAVDSPESVTEALPLSDEPFRVVLIGNMRPSKGQADAIRALGYLRQRRRDVRLTLVGHCPKDYEVSLRALATRLDVSEAVDFVDFTDDRCAYFARSHVALMCSWAEAFGRVTVEAMKLGLPVIGASNAGTRELVRDGWNGLLYPVGDAEQLAERIDRLASNRELRAELGANARTWARQTFSRARHTQDVLNVLAPLVAPKVEPSAVKSSLA
jgi:glycosyltransferase involved in cell wall biosynthesis